MRLSHKPGPKAPVQHHQNKPSVPGAHVTWNRAGRPASKRGLQGGLWACLPIRRSDGGALIANVAWVGECGLMNPGWTPPGVQKDSRRGGGVLLASLDPKKAVSRKNGARYLAPCVHVRPRPPDPRGMRAFSRPRRRDHLKPRALKPLFTLSLGLSDDGLSVPPPSPPTADARTREVRPARVPSNRAPDGWSGAPCDLQPAPGNDSERLARRPTHDLERM